MALIDEIREQPESVRRLLGSGRATIERAAAAVRDREIDHVVVAARGTSDHAAIYAQYVFGAFHGLPVALATPSLISVYGAELRFDRALVVGISQSGASPDVVAVLDAARSRGAPTIALTNTPASALGSAAEWTIDLSAGPERAVAATKTYTAQLVAIAALSAAWRGDQAALAALAALPDSIATALDTEDEVERLAAGRTAMDGCVVLGRGFEYATARELALKLKELAGVFADPYSAADFEHGPLALAEPGLPVIAIAPSGPPLEGLLALLRRLRDDHRADLMILSDQPAARSLSGAAIALPPGVPDWLMPVVSIVPGQLLALHLARARGRDPERPRHIRKVTLTR
jgi:glucosamine--fructose-6-phosphate aminotransferase (isomerizing)